MEIVEVRLKIGCDYETSIVYNTQFKNQVYVGLWEQLLPRSSCITKLSYTLNKPYLSPPIA